MNDGIDTRDKDGELRLTIMASIAQKESRKVSERVKWGIRRQMENGWVYGYSAMLGFRVNNGKLEIVPEEAEVVKRIFNSYVYEGKGCHTIANELNADGLFTVRGKMWREDGVCRILKNDKLHLPRISHFHSLRPTFQEHLSFHLSRYLWLYRHLS